MDKVIHWLREKTGIYMLNAHIDGVKNRMTEQDKKIKELAQSNDNQTEICDQ